MGPTTQKNPVVCGVDVGSTNLKVVALAAGGELLARSSRPTPRSPQDLSVDADVVFDAVEEMLVEVCGGIRTIAALAVVGVGEDGVLIDGDGRPLGRALAWFDPRRMQVHRDLSAALELPRTVLPVPDDPARTLVGWAWARRQPGAEAAASWIALTDYASRRWTARTCMSDTLAARTGAWSPGRRAWVDSRVVAALGDPGLLPEVVCCGEVIGLLRSPRLQAAGVLLPEAVVVAGGHDHPAAGWALNHLVPGGVLDSMGTAEVVVAQSRLPLTSKVEGVDLAPGICQPGSTLLCVQELARNMRWASRDPDVGQALLAIIAGALEPDGALESATFVPGAPGGGEPHYTPDAPSAALSRASAVAGALAGLGEQGVARVIAHAGTAAGEVWATGGWSRSPGWVAVKEAVTHRRLRVVPELEVTAVAAALLAARGLRWTPQASVALGVST